MSGLGFLTTIGFTPGQVLGLFTLSLVLLGTYTPSGHRRAAGYTQTVAMTTSYLMLWVFLTTETLKRFPTGQPFASSPADPSLIPVRLAVLAVYVAVLGRQLWHQHVAKVFETRIERFLAVYRARAAG